MAGPVVTRSVLFHDAKTGETVPIVAVLQADGVTYRLGIDPAWVIGPLAIGAVTVKDPVTAANAQVEATNLAAPGDIGVVVADPEMATLFKGYIYGFTNARYGLGGGVAFQSNDQHLASAPVIAAPGGGRVAAFQSILVSVKAACEVYLTEETSGTLFMTLYMAANSTVLWKPDGFAALPTANKRLMVQTDLASRINVSVEWYPS